MVLLARDIAKQIEAELEYPGQIKVNVIRESRASGLREIILTGHAHCSLNEVYKPCERNFTRLFAYEGRL